MFTRFLPLKVYGDFSRCSRAANSAVLGPIWPNFKVVQDVIVVLVTCKNEEDLIKNEGDKSAHIIHQFFRRARAELVVVSGRNLNSSKLSCMSSLPARVRMINSKMNTLESHYKSMGIFPDAQGQLTPQSLVQSGEF